MVPSPHRTPLYSQDDGSASSPTSSVILITDSISDGWSKIQVDYRNALQICCITGLYAAALTSLTIGFMMILAKSLIQTALIFTILICFAWGTVGIVLSPYSFVPILGFIALGLSLGYAVVIWDAIPFWACNLCTALTGVRCVADTLLLGFIMLVVTFFWCIIWGFAFIGTYDNLSDGSETMSWLPGTNGLVLSLWLFPCSGPTMCLLVSFKLSSEDQSGTGGMNLNLSTLVAPTRPVLPLSEH